MSHSKRKVPITVKNYDGPPDKYEKRSGKKDNLPAGFIITIASNVSKHTYTEWTVLQRAQFGAKFTSIVNELYTNYMSYIMDYQPGIKLKTVPSWNYERGPVKKSPHLHGIMQFTGYCKLDLSAIRDMCREKLQGFSNGPNVNARFFSDNAANILEYNKKMTSRNVPTPPGGPPLASSEHPEEE